VVVVQSVVMVVVMVINSAEAAAAIARAAKEERILISERVYADELVHGDREGRVVAVDDVRGRVADEQDRDPGLVEDPGGEGVVGGQHGPALAAGLGGGQVADGDAPVGDAAVQGVSG